jgi:mannose-6-phosphate isomerase-like protein (cupin superfamily)
MPQDYDIHLDDKFGHQLLIDLDKNTTVTLDPQQGYTVPRGVMHRTRAPERTTIVMIEGAGVEPTGD